MSFSTRDAQILTDILMIRYAILNKNQFRALAKLRLLRDDLGLNHYTISKKTQMLAKHGKKLTNRQDRLSLNLSDAFLACRSRDVHQVNLALLGIKAELGLANVHFTERINRQMHLTDLRKMINVVITDLKNKDWHSASNQLQLAQNYYGCNFNQTIKLIKQHKSSAKQSLLDFKKNHLTKFIKQNF